MKPMNSNFYEVINETGPYTDYSVGYNACCRNRGIQGGLPVPVSNEQGRRRRLFWRPYTGLPDYEHKLKTYRCF